MDLSGILSLGSFGLGLFGSFPARNIHNRQQTIYEEEAELNRQMGAFNAEVSEMSGAEAVLGIMEQTKRVLSQQKAMFAGRGISFEGSPMFVIGETVTMGERQAQEAYFNAQVKKVSSRYQSYGASASMLSKAEQSKFGALSSTIDTAKQLMQAAGIGKSAEKLGVTPNVNIFDYWE